MYRPETFVKGLPKVSTSSDDSLRADRPRPAEPPRATERPRPSGRPRAAERPRATPRPRVGRSAHISDLETGAGDVGVSGPWLLDSRVSAIKQSIVEDVFEHVLL